MAQKTTFMMLPPGLREPVYEYIASAHTMRRVRAVHCDGGSSLEYTITSSATTATCRLIHQEYEHMAKKATTALDFTAVDPEFHHIIHYFNRHVNAKYLVILQRHKATIRVNLILHDNCSRRIEMPDFYRWALFLISVKLDAVYHADPATWMAIFEAADTHADLPELCVIEESSSQAVCENIEEIRRIAGVLTEPCEVLTRSLARRCRRREGESMSVVEAWEES